jgi:hypothetical protein
MIAPIVAAAIAKAAPYVGRFAHLYGSRIAGFIAVSIVQNLRSRGFNIPHGVENAAAMAAAALAAKGISPARSAEQAIYTHTGEALAIGWDASRDRPISILQYDSAIHSHMAPSTTSSNFIPPATGPQTTLLGRLATGQVSSDSVMPPFPDTTSK